MKREKILITNARSYIRSSFEARLQANSPGGCQVETIGMTDSQWKQRGFSAFGSILYREGTAHQKETRENAPLYYQVNRDLTVETAKKAKADGMGQIYLFRAP